MFDPTILKEKIKNKIKINYWEVRVKLTNTQLNKSKSAAKKIRQ